MAEGVVGAKVVIDGDTSGLRRALDSARTNLSSFQGQTVAALQRIDQATAQLANTLASIRSTTDILRVGFGVMGLGGIAMGLIRVTAEMKSMAKEWAEWGEQARKRGVTPEFLSEMQFAAKKTGTSVSVLSSALDTFRVKVASIRVENSAAANSLGELNAELLTSVRGSKDQRGAFLAVADAIKEAKTETEQVRLATEFFGATNANMVHMLARGSDGLKVWGQAAHDAGAVIDKETTASAGRLMKALENIGNSSIAKDLQRIAINAAEGLAVKMGSPEAMTLDELQAAIKQTEATIGVLEARAKAGPSHYSGIVSYWDGIKAAGSDAVEAAGAIANRVSEIFAGSAEEIKAKSKTVRDDAFRTIEEFGEVKHSAQVPNGGVTILDNEAAAEEVEVFDEFFRKLKEVNGEIIKIKESAEGGVLVFDDQQVSDQIKRFGEFSEAMRQARVERERWSVSGPSAGLRFDPNLKRNIQEGLAQVTPEIKINAKLRFDPNWKQNVQEGISQITPDITLGPGVKEAFQDLWAGLAGDARNSTVKALKITEEEYQNWFSKTAFGDMRIAAREGMDDVTDELTDGIARASQAADQAFAMYFAGQSFNERFNDLVFGDQRVPDYSERSYVRKFPKIDEQALMAVEKRIAQAKQDLAEMKEMLASRQGWGAREEAIDLRTAEKYQAAEPPDPAKADAWARGIHEQMVGATNNYYAALEMKRDADLQKFDEYVAELGEAWEGAAQARLDIEAKYDAEIQKIRDKAIQPFTSAISSDLDRAFSDWIDKGELAWDDLARTILADIIKIQMRMAVLQPLFGGGTSSGTGLVGGLIGNATTSATGWLSDLFGSANGNAFAAGRVIPFASGGIVDRPSIFGMRDGQTGLMGEAGPEAIMPLQRGRDGKLGVAGGGQQTNITFNVTATDAESFCRSEGQVTAMLRRAVSRGGRAA